MSAITINEVGGRADFNAFVDLPLHLHPRELYVPIGVAMLRTWWKRGSPHGDPVRLWLARDADVRPVGRTISHADRRMDDKLGRRTQLFGLTEFADGPTVAALADHLSALARADDRECLFGPVQLLPNQSGGVITTAFEQRGFIDSPWNPARYPEQYRAAGFSPWLPADTWILRLSPERVAQIGGPPTEHEWDATGLRIVRGDRGRLEEQLSDLREALNASFTQLPQYTEVSPEELTAITAGLGFLLDEDLFLLAYDDLDRVVAFVLIIPDVTGFMQQTGGRIRLPQLIKLFATRRRWRTDAIALVQGVVPNLQGHGVIRLLIRQAYVHLVRSGYTQLRTTYIGRDNPASARQLELVGGRPLQASCFFTRDVDPG